MIQENKTAWTPGPWVVFDADQSIGTVEDANGLPVAQAQMRGTLLAPAHDERRANARLIAAAPELAEALDKLLAAVNTNELAAAMACHHVVSFSNVRDAIGPALAALAKATPPNPHTEDQP